MTPLSKAPVITVTELKDRLDAGDVPVLVDVRQPYEVEIADLPDHGQVLMPVKEFTERFEDLETVREPVRLIRVEEI